MPTRQLRHPIHSSAHRLSIRAAGQGGPRARPRRSSEQTRARCACSTCSSLRPAATGRLQPRHSVAAAAIAPPARRLARNPAEPPPPARCSRAQPAESPSSAAPADLHRAASVSTSVCCEDSGVEEKQREGRGDRVCTQDRQTARQRFAAAGPGAHEGRRVGVAPPRECGLGWFQLVQPTTSARRLAAGSGWPRCTDRSARPASAARPARAPPAVHRGGPAAGCPAAVAGCIAASSARERRSCSTIATKFGLRDWLKAIDVGGSRRRRRARRRPGDTCRRAPAPGVRPRGINS